MTLCSLAQQADEEHVIHPGFKEVFDEYCQNFVFHLKRGHLRLADGNMFTRSKHQLGRNSMIRSGLWPHQMFLFLFRQSSSRSHAFSSSGMMENIFWNKQYIHREFKEKT